MLGSRMFPRVESTFPTFPDTLSSVMQRAAIGLVLMPQGSHLHMLMHYHSDSLARWTNCWQAS